jgi:hypothetical protein
VTLEVFLLAVEGLVVFRVVALLAPPFIVLLVVVGLVVDGLDVDGLAAGLGRDVGLLTFLLAGLLTLLDPPVLWRMRCASICSGRISIINANNKPSVGYIFFERFIS